MIIQKENQMAMEEKRQKTRVVYQHGASEAVYGLGLIGAWIYYITTATSFWMGALGILKGIFWPATIVYETLKYLGM